MTPTATHKLIESIEDLSLIRFKQCLCQNNLNVLIIEGKPADIDLIECWSNLYAQYLDILGDLEMLYILSLQRDVEIIEAKITAAEAIIPILEFTHIQQLVDDLKFFGFPTKNLKMGNTGYQHNLRQITGRIAHLKLKLEEKQKELLNYYQDQSTDSNGEDFFNRQIARVSKYMGFRINQKETMMPEYVAYLNEYLSQNTKSQVKDDGEER